MAYLLASEPPHNQRTPTVTTAPAPVKGVALAQHPALSTFPLTHRNEHRFSQRGAVMVTMETVWDWLVCFTCDLVISPDWLSVLPCFHGYWTHQLKYGRRKNFDFTGHVVSRFTDNVYCSKTIMLPNLGRQQWYKTTNSVANYCPTLGTGDYL